MSTQCKQWYRKIGMGKDTGVYNMRIYMKEYLPYYCEVIEETDVHKDSAFLG